MSNNYDYIKQGDCLELMKEIPDGSVDCVVTDPPYKTITGGDKNGVNSARPSGMLSGNRKLFTYQNGIEHKKWIEEVFRVLKDGTHCYIFTNSLNLNEIANCAEAVGFRLHNILVWEKNNCTPSQFYMKNCEYILFFRKGRAKYINCIGESKTVHRFDNVIGNKVHPTEKPVDLISFYIKNSTQVGNIVLDPFLGSGTTAIAAIRSNRHYIGFELDEKYFEIAQRRINAELSQTTLF